ncbi:MAG: hypothetical protein RLZZ156_2735, partial [Deinococcota bacterium]
MKKLLFLVLALLLPSAYAQDLCQNWAIP